MRNFYCRIFIPLLIIAGLAGCKLDPPIYPAGTDNTTTGANNGNDPVLTNNGSKITYTLNGTQTTLNMAAFQVIQPDPSSIPNGNTQIIGGTTPEGGFSLSFSDDQTGTYNIDILYLNGLLGENGKVTITQLNTADGLHGTIKGSFVTDLVNISTNETITGVTGTFDVTM